jgi:hypothetical protein
MFSRKYTATFLDSKWQVVKNKIKLDFIPRQGEYVFFNGLYHEVLNIIHEINDKTQKVRILIVINETPHQVKG